jgi:DNA-binding MarR family transcriptional regulator
MAVLREVVDLTTITVDPGSCIVNHFPYAARMATRWLDDDEIGAWVRLIAVVELLPGVLDSQLRRDSDLTHYEYFVLAMLSEAPDRTLRMSALAARTNATLPRLSHVVSRMELRGLVERSRSEEDRRASDVRLTATGWDAVVAAAPGHVDTVRRHVVDPLSREQLGQLTAIADRILERLDPQGVMTTYRRPQA